LPIYEYRCDDCGNTFEMLQRFSDAPVETCELCGGSLRKVLHPAAIHFKGSGFYTTDYARRSSSSPSSSSGDGGADGGSDTSHIAGGTEDVPTFKASDKAKAENRQKKAERAAKGASEKSSSGSSKKS
jgi:putative FmdB family regulatory protein